MLRSVNLLSRPMITNHSSRAGSSSTQAGAEDRPARYSLAMQTSIMAVMMLCPTAGALADETPWRVGVARVNITPELPIWLSGYAARNKPAADKLDDLWAKALVLEDAGGERAVLVTMDIIGIDRELSLEICRRIEERFKLPRAAIALSTTHTHSGPVVGNNLAPMYSLDQRDADRIKNYTAQLVDKLVEVVGDALEAVEPARLSWGTGRATFAVNRRNNPEGEVPQRRKDNALVGPFDHDVPVLAIHDPAPPLTPPQHEEGLGDGLGTLRAVVAGYACHGTVLDDYFVSGDWFGVAQNELERRHPGVIAMIWAGCGADQNPVPRRSVDWLNQHGREFADALDAAVGEPLAPISASLHTAYEEIDLPFGPLPSREELQKNSEGDSAEARYARYLLAEWQRDGKLPATYPYPVQAWRLGDDLTWLFLGGEVVVDYALRLKSELGPKNTWVAAYTNDVMGYIASRRVLAAGGYEGGGSRIYYGLPAVWDPKIEEQIIEAAHRLRQTNQE